MRNETTKILRKRKKELLRAIKPYLKELKVIDSFLSSPKVREGKHKKK